MVSCVSTSRRINRQEKPEQPLNTLFCYVFLNFRRYYIVLVITLTSVFMRIDEPNVCKIFVLSFNCRFDPMLVVICMASATARPWEVATHICKLRILNEYM